MLWARARPRLFSASSLLHPAPPGAVAATPPAPLLRRPHRRVEAAPGNADSEAGGEAQSLPQGQRQLKQRQSALRQPLAEEEEYDEIHKLVQLLPPRVRERLEAHPQLLQVPCSRLARTLPFCKWQMPMRPAWLLVPYQGSALVCPSALLRLAATHQPRPSAPSSLSKPSCRSWWRW